MFCEQTTPSPFTHVSGSYPEETLMTETPHPPTSLHSESLESQGSAGLLSEVYTLGPQQEKGQGELRAVGHRGCEPKQICRQVLPITSQIIFF